MLDEASEKLLAALANDPGGGFRVVEEGELCTGLSPEQFSRSMSLLEAQGLLELRYAEDGAYCLRLLPASRGYIERERSEALRARKNRRDFFLFSMLGAFAGGALSGGIVLMISLLV